MTRNTRLAVAVTLAVAVALAVVRMRGGGADPAPASPPVTASTAAPAGTGADKRTAASASGTTGATGEKGEELAPLFAERLATFAAKGGVTASARGGEVRLGAATLTIDTRIEHDGPTESKEPSDRDKLGVGIAVGAAIDEGPAGSFYFIAPAIGVGRSRAEALEVAVGGWLGLSGTALVEAVAHRNDSRTAVRVGRLVAYPGSLAVRGTTELGWTGKREEELVRAMGPVVNGLRPDLSHSIALTVMVLGGGAIDGQCLLDNRASEELCKAVLKFDFPGSAEGYLLRQVYLLRPATAR